MRVENIKTIAPLSVRTTGMPLFEPIPPVRANSAAFIRSSWNEHGRFFNAITHEIEQQIVCTHVLVLFHVHYIPPELFFERLLVALVLAEPQLVYASQ